jgi:hypothetical protein
MARRRKSGRTVYQTELQKSMALFLPRRGLPLVSGDGRVRWTDRLLVMAAVLMTWTTEPTLRGAFASARDVVAAMYDSRRRPGRTFGGFWEPLTQATPRLLALVGTHLRRQVESVAGAAWRWKGWAVMAADGTRVDCPRTPANEEAFGCAGKPGTGPQMLLTTIFHLATGLPWAWRRSAGNDSERGHLLELLPLLPPETLLIADAGFVGYAMLCLLLAAGHQFVMRVGCNVRLLRKLGFDIQEREGTVYLWPQGLRRTHEPLVLRLVRVKAGRRTMTLLTSVLDPRRLPDADVVELYRRRWGIELLYRSLKQTLRRRKMLSRAAEQAEAELDWALVGLWLLGLMTTKAAGREVRRGWSWSLAAALNVVRGAMRRLGVTRAAGGLRRQLRLAVRDRYIRHRPKAARYWPRKKNEHPPGAAKIRTATNAERLLAQEFRSCFGPN